MESSIILISGVLRLPLIDDCINTTPLSDREILLLVNEKVNTLTGKVDDIRTDNVGKYEAINNVLTTHQKTIDKLNRWQWMELGALGILSAIVTWVVQLICR